MLPTDSASPSWPVHCKLTGLYPPVDCLAPVQWRAKLRRGDVSLLGEVLRRMRCVGGGNYQDRSSGRVACGGAGRPAVKPGRRPAGAPAMW